MNSYAIAFIAKIGMLLTITLSSACLGSDRKWKCGKLPFLLLALAMMALYHVSKGWLVAVPDVEILSSLVHFLAMLAAMRAMGCELIQRRENDEEENY